MTSELISHVGIRFSTSGIDKQVDENWSVDVTSSNYTEGVLTVATSWEPLPLGDVSEIGYCFFLNTGDEEIELGNGLTGPSLLSIPSGAGAGPIQLHGIGFGTPSAKAVQHTSTLRYFIFGQ